MLWVLSKRGGAGGGIAALLNGLYDAEILTSHELVNQITHLDDLVSQADLIIFGEGVKEEDHLLETTTLTIAELAQNMINLRLLFVRLMTNLMSLISTMLQQCLILSLRCQKDTDFKMGIQIRHFTVQHLDY